MGAALCFVAQALLRVRHRAHSLCRLAQQPDAVASSANATNRPGDWAHGQPRQPGQGDLVHGQPRRQVPGDFHGQPRQPGRGDLVLFYVLMVLPPYKIILL